MPVTTELPNTISRRYIRMLQRLDRARQRKLAGVHEKLFLDFKKFAELKYPKHSPSNGFCCAPGNFQSWLKTVFALEMAKKVRFNNTKCLVVVCPLRTTSDFSIKVSNAGTWTCSNLTKKVYLITPQYLRTFKTDSAEKVAVFIEGNQNEPSNSNE